MLLTLNRWFVCLWFCACEKSGTRTPVETGCKHSNAWLPIEAQYNIILDMLKHKITHKWAVPFANNTSFLFHMSFKSNSQTSFEQANGWSFWDWKQLVYNERYFKSDSLHLYVCTFSHIQMGNHLSLYGPWNSISWLKLNSLSSIYHLSVI